MPFVYSVNCNIVSSGICTLMETKIDAQDFWWPRQAPTADVWMQAELWHVWNCWELRRLCSRSCILLRRHIPVFNPRWEQVVLEVYCFRFTGQKEKHQGNAVQYRGTGHLTSILYKWTSHTAHTFVTLLWVGNYFRWVFGVKELFHIEGKHENIMLPWKTFFQCVFSSDNESIVFFDRVKLSISIDSLGTPEWWWYGFFPS